MGDVKVFSLSLYQETETNIFDYWVKNTVIQVISQFLKKDSNVIFYICDNEDEKEDQRHKVFKYWYIKAIELHDFIGMYNYTIQSQNGYKVNSSMLFNKENYLSDYIIEQFKEEIKLF
jgi:hypothetical protein